MSGHPAFVGNSGCCLLPDSWRFLPSPLRIHLSLSTRYHIYLLRYICSYLSVYRQMCRDTEPPTFSFCVHAERPTDRHPDKQTDSRAKSGIDTISIIYIWTHAVLMTGSFDHTPGGFLLLADYAVIVFSFCRVLKSQGRVNTAVTPGCSCTSPPSLECFISQRYILCHTLVPCLM